MGASRPSLEVALGEVIRERRIAAGLSQERLGELAGRHATLISQLERGIRSPTVRTLSAVARALGTSAGRLLLAAERAA